MDGGVLKVHPDVLKAQGPAGPLGDNSGKP